MGNADLVFIFITTGGSYSYIIRGNQYESEKQAFGLAYDAYDKSRDDFIGEVQNWPISQEAHPGAFNEIIDEVVGRKILQIVISEINNS